MASLRDELKFETLEIRISPKFKLFKFFYLWINYIIIEFLEFLSLIINSSNQNEAKTKNIKKFLFNYRQIKFDR